MAAAALEAVESGELELDPPSMGQIWKQWLQESRYGYRRHTELLELACHVTCRRLNDGAVTLLGDAWMIADGTYFWPAIIAIGFSASSLNIRIFFPLRSFIVLPSHPGDTTTGTQESGVEMIIQEPTAYLVTVSGLVGFHLVFVP